MDLESCSKICWFREFESNQFVKHGTCSTCSATSSMLRLNLAAASPALSWCWASSPSKPTAASSRQKGHKCPVKMLGDGKVFLSATFIMRSPNMLTLSVEITNANMDHLISCWFKLSLYILELSYKCYFCVRYGHDVAVRIKGFFQLVVREATWSRCGFWQRWFSAMDAKDGGTMPHLQSPRGAHSLPGSMPMCQSLTRFWTGHQTAWSWFGRSWSNWKCRSLTKDYG